MLHQWRQSMLFTGNVSWESNYKQVYRKPSTARKIIILRTQF